MHPQVSRIARHRHVPKTIVKAKIELAAIRHAQRRKYVPRRHTALSAVISDMYIVGMKRDYVTNLSLCVSLFVAEAHMS